MRNRFDRRARLQSTYQPITPTVNFELLAKSLQAQQGSYDKALEAYSKVPDYIRQSDSASAEAKAYRDAQQQRIQSMSDAFISGGIQKGNIARKEGMRSLLQDFQPGGIANKLETDAKLFNAYQQELTDNKDLTAEVRQAALQRSLSDYEKGYGNKTPFSGYKAQKYIDVQAKLDKLADGFESDIAEGAALINGRRVGKTFNGSYYYVDSDKEEKVDYNDVRKYVMDMAMTDPEIRSFYNQEDDLFGGKFEYTYKYKDKEGKVQEKTVDMTRSQYSMNTIADGLATKYSFLKRTTDSQYKQDWQLKQRNQQAFDKAMQQDPVLQRADLLIKKTNGLAKLDSSLWDRTATERAVDEKLQRYYNRGSALTASEAKEFTQLKQQKKELQAMPENKNQAAQEFIEWSNTPEGREQYPGFYEQYASKSFITANSENSLMLPPAERLELAMNRYNAVVDHSNTQVVKQTSITGKKRDSLNQTIIGDASYGGDLQTYTLYPYNPNTQELGEGTKLSEVLKDSNITEEKWREIKKGFTVTSQIDPDSPGIPGGVRITGFIPDDKGNNIEVDFIIGTPDIQTQNYYEEFKGFYANQRNPLKDYGYGTGFGEPIQMTAPDGTTQVLITEVVPEFNGDNNENGGFSGTTKKVYSYDPVTGAKLDIDPSVLSYDDVELYIRNSNPFKKY